MPTRWRSIRTLVTFTFDPNTPAGQGTGITGVQVFLDDPDQGGIAIGEVTTTTSANPTNDESFCVGLCVLLAVLIKSIAHDKTTAEPLIVGVATVANAIEDCQDTRRQASGWLVLREIRGVNDAAHVPQCWNLKIVRLEQDFECATTTAVR